MDSGRGSVSRRGGAGGRPWWRGVAGFSLACVLAGDAGGCAPITAGGSEAGDGGETSADPADLDGDGARAGYGDCDDADPTVHPGAPERCNGIDDDCDGVVDGGLDQDADGFSTCLGDCDDADPQVHPGAPERCNGVDDDCFHGPDDAFDRDGDGHLACGGAPDCDDGDPEVHPGGTEVCDGRDGDCDGATLPGEVDGDGDGVLACAGDCDDADAARAPGRTEACNGVDDDCDPGTDEAADGDGDGTAACDGDCDDGDATVHHGAPEVCNGQDDDCDGEVEEGIPSCAGCAVVTREGTAYLLCEEATDWPTARAACEAAGYALATPRGDEEVAWLFAAGMAVGPGVWWIGFHDMDDEGAFVGVDGSPVDGPWGPDEPQDPGHEDCASLIGICPQGCLADLDCDRMALPRICEAPPRG
ncbi:hypothetical protein L6R50_17365 [Myxococcota bacterium]|nr:hypothetical protein [Myxococcota bacterium]